MNYLNETGLQYFWGKIKDYVAENAGSGGGGGTVNWSNIQGKPSDLVTDVVISGSGNAVTNASFSSGTLTLTKGTISGGGGEVSGDYLPLSGGTMTGEIVSTSRNVLSASNPSMPSDFNVSISTMNGIVLTGDSQGYAQIAPNYIHLMNDSSTNVLQITDAGIAKSSGGSNSSVWNTNGGITTFKTINNQSIIGSGNITISSSGGGSTEDPLQLFALYNSVYTEVLPNAGTCYGGTPIIKSTSQSNNEGIGIEISGDSNLGNNISCSACAGPNGRFIQFNFGLASTTYDGLMRAGDTDKIDYLWSELGQELEADNLAMDIYSSGNTLYSRLYNTDTSSAVIDHDSGVTLKTINGESIIGSGDITISSGTGGITQTAADARYLKKAGDTCTGNLAISGQVAIGTTSFDQALRVNGAIVVGDNGLSGTPCSLFMSAGFQHNDPSPNFAMSQAGVFTCKGNITTQANLTVSGGASFGDPVSMGDVLEVADSITALSFYESSDVSLKENITSITKKAVDAADCLNFKQFNFKDDEDKVTKYGVIAQEVEAVGLNNLVSTDKSGIKSVDYISLLILKIEALEKRIAELEAERR